MRVLFIALVAVTKLSCIQGDQSITPSVVTTINLDRAANSVPSIDVPVKVIYRPEWFEREPSQHEQFIPWIVDLVAGAENTIIVFDYMNSRLVRMTNEGQFMHSIGGPGSGPGEFVKLQPNICQSDGLILVPDQFGFRLSFFDGQGKFRRAIQNASVVSGSVAIGKNGSILSIPHGIDRNSLSHMVLLQDSLGKVQGTIGEIQNDGQVFKKDPAHRFVRELYYVVANRFVDYFWCVFKYYPIMNRYNYQGSLMEQVRFESANIDEELKESQNVRKRHGVGVGGVLLIREPQLFSNGDMLINVASHGNLKFSTDQNRTSLINRFKIQVEGQEASEISEPDRIVLVFLNRIFYAYDFDILLKGTSVLNQLDGGIVCDMQKLQHCW